MQPELDLLQLLVIMALSYWQWYSLTGRNSSVVTAGALCWRDLADNSSTSRLLLILQVPGKGSFCTVCWEVLFSWSPCTEDELCLAHFVKLLFRFCYTTLVLSLNRTKQKPLGFLVLIFSILHWFGVFLHYFLFLKDLMVKFFVGL